MLIFDVVNIGGQLQAVQLVVSGELESSGRTSLGVEDEVDDLIEGSYLYFVEYLLDHAEVNLVVGVKGDMDGAELGFGVFDDLMLGRDTGLMLR
jgi:hypothetical protein